MITKLNRRLAAACLAAAMALGGLVGAGAVADTTPAEAPQEEAVYFIGHGSVGGGATTNGATWS